MTWADATSLAARSVRRRFGRTFLTILAVALAAALLTALMTIANTAKERVLGQLSKGGPLAGIRVFGAGLHTDSLARIRELPAVSSAVPVVVRRQAVVPPDPPTFDADAGEGTDPAPFLDGVVGVELARPELLPVTLLAGRLPEAASLTEVAVTEGYLERVGVHRDHPTDVLGTELVLGTPRFEALDEEVWVRWSRATIVGVVAQEAGSGTVLAPIQQVEAAASFAATEDPHYDAILVEARDLDSVGDARRQIAGLGYSSSAPENLIATVQKYLRVVEMVLSAIGLIALVIAALGISNALFASVRERRREIGVLKAIGARDRDILRIVLIEAAVIGVLGGILGTAGGWAIAATVAAVVNDYLVRQGLVGVVLSLPAIIVAAGIAGSTALAVVAGVMPAFRAARLPARQAVMAG